MATENVVPPLLITIINFCCSDYKTECLPCLFVHNPHRMWYSVASIHEILVE